ncbi:MAG: fimbrillin family protein [Prevotellaceae bacterium]|jgi:hypothetical protein|nr:fimbrillin family protein [Prevotellaceae bacterium]
MHKQNFFICAVLLSALLYACSSDNDNSDLEKRAVDLTVKSSHTFKTGDAIGIFVEKRENQDKQSVAGSNNYKTNVKWVCRDDGTWAPASPDDAIYMPDDGRPIDIYAYYPYTGQAQSNEISISSTSGIMTGTSLNVNESKADLILHDKTSLVKIIIPDTDILSTAQITMIGVLSGGTIYPAKLGTDDDFAVSTTKRNQPCIFENGYYAVYLPEQVFEENKHLLAIEDGDNVVDYIIPEQFQVTKDGENCIVVNTTTDNLADLPNTFMVKPGNEIFISVQKAYQMWQTNDLLAATSPDLSGDIQAEIIWQESVHEVIENIDVIGSKENAVLHIKTKSGNTGNAVVAVKIGEHIRWSWQLWISDYNPSSKESGTTYHFNGLTFMDRNLGATGDPDLGGDRTFGLYYQWGRKDPMLVRAGIESMAVTTDVKTNLANSIMYPNIFITSSNSPNDWYAKTGNLGSDRWNSNQNRKTVFDPCPKGWRVPAATLDDRSPWAGLSLPEDENKWGNGWHFEETPALGYYPAAGHCSAVGSITYAGSAGFYHTAKSVLTTMRIDFTSINLAFGGGRASGRSVRCVKEY